MKRQMIFKVACVILLGTCISCNTNSNSKDKIRVLELKHAENAHSKDDCSHVHWGYEGEESPDKWKNLCGKYKTCGGKVQSPINIEESLTMSGDSLPSLQMNYGTSEVDIINNGHTVQFNIFGDNYLVVGDKKYKLLQFHFHTLSEHTINGKHAPIEVHFVHKHSNDDYAVVGALFSEGKQYELFSKYLAEFPSENGEVTKQDDIELAELLPDDLSYYYYHGSLTTPPCSEVVNWYVLRSSLEASKDQITGISGILHDNYRPTMPLNSRTVFAHAN